MNLPNKLTVFRIFLVPFTIVFMLCIKTDTGLYISGVLFVLASLTDMLDGWIARKYNMITDFGKFMDPLADKLLICSVLVCLVELKLVPSWAVILVLAREFAISGFRMIAANKKLVIAASRLGKRKANFQTFWIISLLFPLPFAFWEPLQLALMIIALLLTVGSFIEYLVKNKEVLKEAK